ncbi:hypothetical protein [Roseisolibacter sp. H3M3-2]|uniref:hypothetical protein n=1 Tax=Roseisolibacter sp. H3M3-2 TaxID=3031323 RepID=UPI0023DAF53F|nr:hypothetical protein [Roseisolibacter sp. H3M3-2]MDF1505101.1 hypothetical protein [Roseisolibacter sp. H3M3-2]
MSHAILTRGAALLLLGAAACSDGQADAITAPNFSATPVERTADGIQHRVTLDPARPATGDTVVVRSVLVNRGAAPARVEHVVCGLDYDRNPVLADPFIHCAAYSVTSTLAPGDSIVQQDRRVIAAPAGTYTVRVRHVVPPSDVYVDLPITVSARR